MQEQETQPRRLAAGDLALGRADASLDVKFSPYWWDAAPREAPSSQQLPSHVEAVIVGSGFTGLSAALTLLNNGCGATVLDRGVLGYGASTRNGGQIGSGNQKFRVKRLIALRGETKAAAMLREGVAMLDYIEALVGAEKIECHFRRCGRFRVCMQPDHYEAMARDLEDLKAIANVESYMVPRAEQHTEIKSDVFFGGSVLPDDASLHPGLYHAGLIARVREKGGNVFGNTAVEHIDASGSEFLISTSRGQIRAKHVIVATNGYTDSLVPELGRRIVPIGSGLIATEPLEQRLFDELLPKKRVYGNSNRVFYYFRGAPDDRRIIWGGRVGRTASSASPHNYRHLARDMLRVFPQLRSAAITHAWDGMIGYTFDEVPHIGRTSSGVHYALGYCGTGVSRATYFGHKIALKVVGDARGNTSFDDLTFPAFPAHPIATRAVPVVETWYRVRDAINR